MIELGLMLMLMLMLALLPTRLCAAELKPYTGAGCAAAPDEFFLQEVWAKVGSRSCLKCHKPGGDAEASQFVLRDPQRTPDQTEAMRHNLGLFTRMARLNEEGQSRLLLKVVGGLDHGGEDVLAPDSAGYRVLAEFVGRVNTPSVLETANADQNLPPFFQDVIMLDDQRLLRRVTLSLAGRLPSPAERSAVRAEGLEAFPALLNAIMKEDAFYDRLREAFNDIFLTVGYDGVPENALSYEHFSETRHWNQRFDFSHIAGEKERTRAGYKLTDDYRAAMLGEPMRLIEHIVRNDRPFTEMVTADYIMVTPYTARGYGVYEEVAGKYKDPENPFEYLPVTLKALIGRNKSDNQESATGLYPHAGLLSTFQYLKRYPTTETNRNRQRARVYFLQFLGIDVLDMAARVSDAAAVTAKYENPTMQAMDCVVCHRTIDPVAGLFQNYWSFEGVYGRRKGGWFTDMFEPGFEGETLPEEERWRALPWLGERTARDPRFAVAMVEHAYYVLTGRSVLLPPKDLDDPLYLPRRRAYLAQRQHVEEIARRFAENGFNFKHVIRDWVMSDFYRADGLATADLHSERRVELDDVGVVRMLAPEQLERKVAAIFGQPWGRLNEQMALLYGGIDSKQVTERASDPSGAMGAIQRILANDVACKQTALDFTRPPADRKLFPKIEPDVVPGTSLEADGKIRGAMAYLHERILGREEAPDSVEVGHTFQLFADIVNEAASRSGLGHQEIYACRRDLPAPLPDPHYTVRAWRGVITYLLRRHEFLYE
jgi:hypothetical protein